MQRFRYVSHVFVINSIMHLSSCFYFSFLSVGWFESAWLDQMAITFFFFLAAPTRPCWELWGAQLVSVWSCGLHASHNVLKTSFPLWEVDKLLKAIHMLFLMFQWAGEDYMTAAKSTGFSLPFCGPWKLENIYSSCRESSWCLDIIFLLHREAV